MSVVEDLIVAMKFDNKQFEAAVKISAATLQALKGNLNFGGSPNGIDKAAASAAKFNGGPMSAQIDGISAKFLALGTIAATALSNITNKVVDTATAVAKSFTIEPVTAGFNEYELKMKSIQTILANTQSQYPNQSVALADITKNLDELNTYADKTIYNFGDMTKNIGLFTNAGLGVSEATQMIKGFSNEAAASGTDAQQAAGAAYQLSQAMSAGVVTLMDFKSLTNVGMGNANMKKGIVEIAEAMGAFEGTSVTAEEASKNFNNTLEKKWLTKDVMGTYLKIQAEGNEDVNRKMLAGIGIVGKQADAFIKQQKTSEEAATKVRTFTALMDTLKEGVGSSWSETFGIILGDFEGATTLFTGISNAVGGIIGRMGDARNELLSGWAKLGGRDILIKGFQNLGEAFKGVIAPIRDAFRQIFPSQTPQGLLNLTKAFTAFTEKLKVGSETAANIKRTFAGVFAVFGIAVSLIKGVAAGIGSMFGAMGKGTGGILSFTGGIGDFLVKLHETIKTSGIFTKIFTSIGSFLQAPIALLGAMAAGAGAVIGKMAEFGGVVKMVFDILGSGDYRGGPFDEDSKFVDVLFRIREAFVTVTGAITQFWNVLTKGDFTGGGPFEEDSPIIDQLFKFRDKIKEFFTPSNIAALFGAGAAGAVGFGLFKVFKNAIDMLTGKKDGGILGELKGAFTAVKDGFNGVAGMFDQLTGALKTMQANVKTTMILKIAIAVGILALSMKLLATMDVKDLITSLSAITIAMGLLVGALAIISKIAGAPGIVQMPVIAAGLAILAVAVGILAISVRALSGLSWEELAKGLAGVAAMLTLLVGAAYGLGKSSGPLLRAGLAMIPLAVGLRLLVLSVKEFSTMSWEEFGKGMAGLAASLAIVAGAMQLMPKNMPFIAAGLVLVGGGLLIMSKAIQSIGSIPLGTIIQGMIGIATALGIIAGALYLMPKNMLVMGVGLLAVSAGLVAMSQAIQSLGGMSVGDLAKGLIGMAAGLGILATALYLMSGAMAGAQALIVAALGLSLLMVPIMAMAALSWQDLLSGLGGLAAIMTILGVSAYLLTPVAPILLAIGVGVAALGVGLMAIGGAAYVFALAFEKIIQLIVTSGQAISTLLLLIPQFATAFALAIGQFVITIGSQAAGIMGAFGKLLNSLLDVLIAAIPRVATGIGLLLGALLRIIIQYTPQVGQAFLVLLQEAIRVIVAAVPMIADGALQLMTGFLNAIAGRIGEVVTAATNVIVAFLNAIGANLPRIIQAGFDLVINFLNGLANAIDQNMPRVTEAAGRVGRAIIDGVVNAIKGGIGSVINAAKDMAKSALDGAKNFLGIKSPSREFYKVGEFTVQGLVNGIGAGTMAAGAAGSKLATGVVNGFTKGAGKQLPKVLDGLFKKIEEGMSLKKGEKLFGPMAGAFTGLSKEVLKAELALAEFYGEVNRADPKSVAAYVEKTGGKVKYLAGLFDGLKESAELAFGMMAEGKTLDKVLGSEDFLSSILKTGLSVIPGLEGELISSGVFLGLAVIDGILSVFLGPGTTVLGTLGKWIEKLVRAIGGWFGIKFPVDEELSESDKALEDFMVKVDDGHGRFEKLTEEAVKSLTDQISDADKIAQGLDGINPVITPQLNPKKFLDDFDKFLDSLNTGPGLGVFNVIGTSLNGLFNGTIANLQNLFGFKAQPQAAPVTNVTYNQTNNSPKALDHVEVYKATKSQISLAREELGIS